nr:retrovirus-related Pol polyprotein from transposon TNT 1-94 [Tanacetum cinerariifolium]
MGYEHLSSTLEMESDEVTKSNVENLLPIPSKCEVTLEDKKECDLPIYENSPVCDHSDIFIDSKIDDDILVYNDEFEDTEYVKASLSDPEIASVEKIVSVEEENVVQQQEEEVNFEDISQIQDVVLCEKLLSITRLISKIESLKYNSTPDRVFNSFESDNSLLDNFSPEFKTFCDYSEEMRSGNTTHADNSLPESAASADPLHQGVSAIFRVKIIRVRVRIRSSFSGFRFELITYSDADHARCNDDCKSTSGGIQFLGDKLVSWSSKKKDCIAMSTTEAGYVSLSACCAQVIWMRTQLLDYGLRYNKIPMYYDSKSDIAISCNRVQHSRTKHINIRYHFIKEHVEKGTIEIYFVETEYQLTDLFKKPFQKKVEAQENIAKVQEKLVEEEIEKLVEGDEDEESYASEFADLILNDDIDDSGTRLEPESHKENPKKVDDDDEEIEKDKDDEEIKKEMKDEEIEKEVKDDGIEKDRNVSSFEKTVSNEYTTHVSQQLLLHPKTHPQENARNNLFLPGRFQETLDHCNKVVPDVTFSKTKEMITQEMPCLVNLAVNKDREVDPIKAKEMITKEFVTHGPKMIEDLFRKYMQNTTLNLYLTTSSSTAGNSSVDLQHQLYMNMKSNPQDQAADSEL